jgi:hypothetical protein
MQRFSVSRKSSSALLHGTFIPILKSTLEERLLLALLARQNPGELVVDLLAYGAARRCVTGIIELPEPG